MESDKLEKTRSVTPYRATRSRVNSASSESSASHVDLPTTSTNVRTTRLMAKEIEKHVATPMPKKTKRSESMKNAASLKKVSVLLSKFETKPNSVEASIGQNIVLEEVEIFGEKKSQSTEVAKNESKGNKVSSSNDDDITAEPPISKVHQSTGTSNSMEIQSIEEPIDLDAQPITIPNLPDPIDSLKSKSDVELIESIVVQDKPTIAEIPMTRAQRWRQTLGGTIEISSENEVDIGEESELVCKPTESVEKPQTILGKSPLTANNYVKDLPTINPYEFDTQLTDQPGSLSNNQNDVSIESGTKSHINNGSFEKRSSETNTTSTDIEFREGSSDAIHQESDGKPIDDNLGIAEIVADVVSPQSTKPSIRKNDEMDQSVVDGERDSLMFSDDQVEMENDENDWMDVTVIDETQNSVDVSSSENDENDWMDVTVIDETQNSVDVSSSSVSFNASETSIDFLAATRVNSDINNDTESKAQSKRPIMVLSNSEVQVSNELENLESKPRKILKPKRHSGSMVVSKEVKKRMSLHPNIKLQSEELKLSEGGMTVSKESFESMQHESKTEEDFKDQNRSQHNRIDENEVMWKDVQKMPKTSKRHSSEMPISKEVIKRMSLHPNAKLSSGQMVPDVLDGLKICKVGNVAESTEHQSNSHNETENTNQDDLSKELENMSANPEKTSKRLPETLPRPKLVLKRVGFDQSILQNSNIDNYSTTTPLSVWWATSSLAKYDPKLSQKRTSTLVRDDSNDDSGTMEVDTSVHSAYTSNKCTSGSEDETSQQLKRKQERKLRAKKGGREGKMKSSGEKSKDISEEDTSNVMEKDSAHLKFLPLKHAIEPKIITTKVSRRDLKRKVDSTSYDDNSSIMQPKIKKRKMQQALETSTPKIRSKPIKRYPTQHISGKLDPKRNLKKTFGAKINLSKVQWTTAGPFMVTEIPTNNVFKVESTSQFTVTCLSGSSFNFGGFKNKSKIYVQNSVGKR